MASGGMRKNSRLPNKGAGRPSGPRNSDGTSPDGHRPGIKGGSPHPYTKGEGKTKQWQTNPEEKFGASLLELEDGAREIRNILMEARYQEKLRELVEVAFTRARAGEFRFYEDIMNRIGGKPVSTQTNVVREMTGDEVASMAEQIKGKFEKEGLHAVPDEEAGG